ncbi:hypothetical protein [Geomesophilobacter sediminis]|uniref:Uncharacterized protein n=1 Tax=Geomesophilobacter sediminis TaxID=2798584 RepID=A0A8J7JLI8_9BACT|nr:hypothetical protein [Geomesophilobacter sediminis]MBJ6725205.1 hypothetical protein [Geomesophilobacter sediminis]
METEFKPMTAESVAELLKEAGAQVMVRAGRSENYSAPREFSFEVKSIFENGMGLHVVARQFNYRDPWEAEGRVNDLVDAMLLRDGALTALPKGYPYFQGTEEECNLDEDQLREVIDCVRKVNVKVYLLQELTGDR